MVCYKMKKDNKKEQTIDFWWFKTQITKFKNEKKLKLGVTDQTGILFKFHLFKTQL